MASPAMNSSPSAFPNDSSNNQHDTAATSTGVNTPDISFQQPQHIQIESSTYLLEEPSLREVLISDVC